MSSVAVNQKRSNQSTIWRVSATGRVTGTGILLGLVVSILAAMGIGVGAEAAAPTAPSNVVPANALGTFAGYRWFGTAHSISAEWRIPRILQSQEGHASTWIGLQNEAGAFVQIGTLEDASAAGSMSGNSYAGFWSGDQVEFHPQPAFSQFVLPGDLISASISETKDDWKLQMVDIRSGAHFAKTVGMASTDMTEAEWFQEDPTNAETVSPDPYPSLSKLQWMKLMINDQPPSLTLSNQVWMSVPGIDFAPTAVKDDSFSVSTVQLDPIQIQWVTAAAPYRSVATRFDDEEGTWPAHPPSPGDATIELQPFLVALSTYEQSLAAKSWPSVPQVDINELVLAFGQDATALTALAEAEPEPSTSVITRLDQTRTQLRIATQKVDGDMGLP